MSNKITLFFLWVYFALLGAVFAAPSPQVDSLMQKAAYLFEYENFYEAIAVYENILQTGYYQENMLYRLAYMYEQVGNFPQSIYYLRRIEWETGGDHIPEKIEQLMGKTHRERLSTGESWGSYRLFVNHQFLWLAAFLVLLTLMTGLFLIPKHNNGILTATGLFAGLFAMTLSLMLIEHNWFHPERAVVMQPTAYYDDPAFGANYHSLPIGVGATVTVLEKQDIWCRVAMNQFEVWVPEFTLKMITD